MVIAVAGKKSAWYLSAAANTHSHLHSNIMTHTQISRGDSDTAPEDFKSGAGTCIMRVGLAAPNLSPPLI